MTRPWRRLLAGLMLLASGLAARADDAPLKIGVLSFRSQATVQAQWQPLAEYLQHIIWDARFEVKAYDYAGLKQAIRAQEVDLVITQPAEYVRMVHQNGLSSPLATLINLEEGKPVRAFGGVILTLQSRDDLKTLKDLDGKRIATPSTESFGGYLAQAYEMSRAQVRPGRLVETGVPQDRVLDELLAGEVDAAFVRTGMIEALAAEGRLDLKRVKVLNRQDYAGYPFALSTRLYPEWPVVVMSHVPDEMSARLAGALLSLPHGGMIARRIDIYGFTTPSDYEPVRALMRELRVPPFDVAARVTLQDIWAQYSYRIVALLVALGALVALALRELVMRQRLTSFGNAMGEGMYVLDRRGRTTYVNKSACEMLGYAPEELLGRKILEFIVSPANTPKYEGGLNPLIDPARSSQPYEGENSFVTARGEPFPVEVSMQPVLRKGKFLRSVTVFDDISERRAQSERVYQLAFYDAMTGLPNRRLLLDRLQQALNARAGHSRPGALLLCDLDRFAQLNDTLGHARGDALLRAVAGRLGKLLGDEGTVAHPGGDEFAVLLDRIDADPETAMQQARSTAERIRALMGEPFEIDGQQHKLSTSIGIVMFEGAEDGAEELFKRADIAMYEAKKGGRNTFRFFDQQIERQLSSQVALEADLNQALQKNQFEVFYQPKVDVQGTVFGVEALVRWRHPQRGLVSPGEFISLAEETGLIVPLGNWVLEQACQQINAWRRHRATAHLTVSVNLCAHQIFQPDFVARVASSLRACGTDPGRIQLELTESVLAKNFDDVIDKMQQLVALGVNFALDDFGTGYSSLSYLKRLPLQQLKIDASFVRDLMTDPNDVAIARTIIALGHSLDLEVLAEGVETTDQRDILIGQGCQLFQGYLFGRPQPPAELERRLGAATAGSAAPLA